jgi:hypothetical protein
MTVEELAVICQAHEGIKTGGRNCKFINAAYKLISTKRVTKNKKIEAINKYFDTVANEVLAELLVLKYNKENITVLLDGEQSGEIQSKG